MKLILLASTLPQQENISIWTMILKGGWLMLPIFILSLIAVYLFIDRYALLRRYSKNSKEIIFIIKEHIINNNFKEAQKLCQENPTPQARILEKGIAHAHLPIQEMRQLLDTNATLEVAQMESGLNTIASCASMAPMIGFLGTVIGMIQAFYDMAMAGNNVNITLLSRGIYTAMITTVAGLIVGIIAQFAYNTLVARIDKIVHGMEFNNAEFIEALYKNNGINK